MIAGVREKQPKLISGTEPSHSVSEVHKLHVIEKYTEGGNTHPARLNREPQGTKIWLVGRLSVTANRDAEERATGAMRILWRTGGYGGSWCSCRTKE